LTKVIIIGAGPAGLFAANELAGSCEVTVVDRKWQIGGAGLRVDGKLNFHSQIGCNLLEFVSLREAENIISSIKEIFSKYIRLNIKYSTTYVHHAIKKGIKYIPIQQVHIGSDELPLMMESFKDNLEKMKVKFQLDTLFGLIEEKNKRIVTSRGKIKYDYLLIATGRYGFYPSDLRTKFNPIDVGIRVEVLNEVFKDIRKEVIDPKFHIRTSTYDDFIRTFCTCYDGFVVKDNYSHNLIGINGHSYSSKGRKSPNTNFALLEKIELTEPTEDTTKYGLSIVS